jgi:hypothetical protein
MPPGGRPRRLRVGPAEAIWDGGGLRWISLDRTEVLRGILLTARDADWRSLQPRISGVRIAADADRFSIAFDVRFRGNRFLVDGHVRFDGDRSGRMDAAFTARVAAETVSQRLGLVVLHPAAVAGRPFEAVGDAGETQGDFAVFVTADRFATAMRAMRWDASDGVRASLAFDGDVWETEDQRAWTDASFKSYSPPLDRAHPVTLPAGRELEIGVHLGMTRADGQPGRTGVRPRHSGEGVKVRDDDLGQVPPIGLGWSGSLGSRDAARLRALRPAHLRAVADRTRGDWRAQIQRAARDVAAVGTSLQLELVAFADDDAREELAGVLGSIDVPLAGVLAFGTADDAGLVTSDGSGVGALRERLRVVVPGIEVGGGSRANYAELAAADVPVGSLDAIAFSVTPQIHATDAATVIENLATLPVLMESATILAAGRPLDVLGSFRPRFDAYATPVERGLAATRFDGRLAGDLGTAWLIGTLAGLLQVATGRLTVLEAAGPAGVLPSAALVEILEATLATDGGRLLRVEATGGCAAYAIVSGNRLRVIVANLRRRATTLRITLPTGWHVHGDVTGHLRLEPLGHQVIEAEQSYRGWRSAGSSDA